MMDSEEQDWEKEVGQFRLTLNGFMKPLRKYGQGVYVDGVSEEIVHLAIQLYYKLSGVDMPFEIRDIHW